MRLVMMGTGTFAEPTFEALLAGPHSVVGLVTQPDRQVGQERGSTRQTGKGMKNIAQEYGVPVYQPESINTLEGVQQLRSWQPDLLVVAAYGQILAKDVLAATPLGGINVHASLLPKYRGAAPIAWAIWSGERETGVTIIKMSVGLDAGEMLAQEAVAILAEETAGELEAKLAPLGARLALKVIDQISAGAAVGIKQDKSQVTKAPKLTKEHGLIDWSQSADTICNHFRAMQPWPTAYTFFHRSGQKPLRLIITKGAPHALNPPCKNLPGTVAIDPNDAARLLVSTAERTLVEILELQPAGKKRMSAAEFVRGRRPQVGDFFGPES